MKYRRHENNITSENNFKKINVSKIIEQYKGDVEYAKNKLASDETINKFLVKIDEIKLERMKKMKVNKSFIDKVYNKLKSVISKNIR